MQQYKDLLQEWLDFHDDSGFTVTKGDGGFADLVKKTKEIIKNGFRCTCERCTGIPDADSYYKD